MTKKRLLILVCFVLTLPAYAQKNRIEIGLSGYRFYDVLQYYKRPYILAKIRYHRAIQKHISLSTAFSFSQFSYRIQN